jgi:hypothetical protein
MKTNAPWWVPYVFLAALVGAAFTFTMQGRMTPAEFLAFAAALGFRVPQSEPTDASRVTTETVDVQAEGDVTVKNEGGYSLVELMVGAILLLVFIVVLFKILDGPGL